MPMLESFGSEVPQSKIKGKAKKLICVGFDLGFHREALYPTKTGRDYEATKLSKAIDKHRDDFTIFSGLDHRAGHGHHNWSNFLCGPKIGSTTLDQIVASKIGENKRYTSLQLTAGTVSGGRHMVYSKHGIPLPAIQRPSVLFKKMFSSKEDLKRTDYLLRSGQSTLDTVLADLKGLNAKVNPSDKRKLDEYYTSLREVERNMSKQRTFLKQDPPTTDYKLPDYDPIAASLLFEAEKLMYDLMALAIQTDLTNVITLHVNGVGSFAIDGKNLVAGYHGLSHHRMDPAKIRDLIKVETEHLKCFDNFLTQLKEKKDLEGKPLLDTTAILMGTGMGNADVHSNADCPTIVAGGGFKHGSHIATDPKAANAQLLGNLYVTLMNQVGIESDTFANAKGRMEIA